MKLTITFQDYHKLCKQFTRERYEQYIERKGIRWIDLFQVVESADYKREAFNKEIDSVVDAKYHSSQYPKISGFTIKD